MDLPGQELDGAGVVMSNPSTYDISTERVSA